jgi:hypothetical protein
MKYCWNCGQKLDREGSKFCTGCGADLQPSNESTDVTKKLFEKQQAPVHQDKSGTPTLGIFELGKKLEESVSEIFRQMGYETETRHHFTQLGGAEIDVLVRKGKRKMAVECKNYDESREVGIKELRDFKGKLDQIGIVSGLFVTTTFFSQPAEEYADSTGIELWNKSKLVEKFFAYFTGRGMIASKTIRALNVAEDFATASAVNLKNPQSIRPSDATLIYHPYHVIK